MASSQCRGRYVIPESGESGFDLGYHVEKILDAFMVNNQVQFLLKFTGAFYAQLLPAALVYEKVPQLVIHFYEQRIIWHSDSEE